MLTQPDPKGKILLAIRDDTLRTEYFKCLKKIGFHSEQARDSEEIQAICHHSKFDVLLIDDRLADSQNGFQVISEMKHKNASLEIVVFVENVNKYKALNAVKAGVSDWVSSTCGPDELEARFERIIRDQAFKRALINKQCESEKIKIEMEYVLQGLKEMVRSHGTFILPERMKKRGDFPEIIGNSGEIEKVLELVHLVARTNATVLITGESGTGKELITRAIHTRSTRSDRPFVPVNCAALPETLLESELFGHEKGAFTGAVTAKQGLIEEAEGGTLFLDEISEMPLSFQVKLLRVLQYGEYKRVGASKVQTADIRIISATNTSLEMMVKDGSFREDLFHRINQFQINIPPLRERIEDLPMLNQYFLERACREYDKPLIGFSSKLIEKMYRYAWPMHGREMFENWKVWCHRPLFWRCRL